GPRWCAPATSCASTAITAWSGCCAAAAWISWSRGCSARTSASRTSWRDGAGMDVYEGGCHCGAVRFRVALERYEALECNCSMCSKKGNLHLIVAREHFTLLRGADSLTTYQFNTGV